MKTSRSIPKVSRTIRRHVDYEASVQTGDVTAFGVDPVNVLTGVETIPEEGIRMNAGFAGTTSGELTGDFSGTDYG